jgi:hypothetical protein
MALPVKAVLEDLLRQRRLHAEAPPLRGEERLPRPLATGVSSLDALLGGGLPRGQLSELFGPASSGRTGLALSAAAGATRGGALVAWVDPADRLDPASVAEAGVDLPRLLWLRGSGDGAALTRAVSAVATVVGSGLFELVVLDLAGLDAEARRLPGATWIRMQRLIEERPGVLLLLGQEHTARGPGGASIALETATSRWTGEPGPGRLLVGLGGRAWCGRAVPRAASFELQAGP